MTIKIQGFNSGLLITLGEGNWKKTIDDLLNQIENHKSFYEGARVALDCMERKLSVMELSEIRDDLGDRDISLLAIISQSQVTERNARLLGLETKQEILQMPRKGFNEAIFKGQPAIYINKTLRSGNKVEFEGTVVIHGDVNPGAVINAVGSVMVWGKLYGNVVAGKDGDCNQIVCALYLKPSQLRIANISLKDIILKPHKKPEKAFILGDTIVINDWDTK